MSIAIFSKKKKKIKYSHWFKGPPGIPAKGWVPERVMDWIYRNIYFEAYNASWKGWSRWFLCHDQSTVALSYPTMYHSVSHFLFSYPIVLEHCLCDWEDLGNLVTSQKCTSEHVDYNPTKISINCWKDMVLQIFRLTIHHVCTLLSFFSPWCW